MKKLNIKKKIRLIDFFKLDKYHLDNSKINLINVNFSQNNAFDKISDKSNIYIKKSFEIAFKILKSKITDKFINGPISKKFFLKKKFSITVLTKTKLKILVLIFNPIFLFAFNNTSALKKVLKINANRLRKSKINKYFYKKTFKKTLKLHNSLNPHCESVDKINEDEKIIDQR